jgi:hypothetical protein
VRRRESSDKNNPAPTVQRECIHSHTDLMEY